jgi:signal transduction histidine kinase
MKTLPGYRAKRRSEWGISAFPLFWVVVIAGMASLLVTVAVLQYRWTKELSEAAEARIGSTLKPLMLEWHLDLYSEMSAICVAMQVGPDSGAHDAWNDYLQRFADWNEADGNGRDAETEYPNPDLILGVYEWQSSAGGTPELLRLDANSKTLNPASSPADWQPLLDRLGANSANLGMAMRAWEFGSPFQNQYSSSSGRAQALGSRSNALAGWQLDDRIPALVHPVVHHADPFNSQTPVKRVAVDWMVVILNMDYIQNKILPTLTNRYFAGPEGLEYKVAVIDPAKASRLMYTSRADFPDPSQNAFDSQMNIFGPPPKNVEANFGESIKSGETMEWRNFSATVWFPVIQYLPHEEPWTLVLQHRTGPLAAIAADIWRRNLLTGGVVLVLLTAGMALILFTSRRAQTLAKLQLDFVASVSHELLTPLAAIYCTGQNFTDGLVRTQNDMISHGTIITTQARQLTDLVRQILLFASTESGTNRYTMRTLDVAGILQSVRENVAVLVEGAGCRLKEDLEPDLPYVVGDLSAISRCLQNLVSNAVKYGARNGSVKISASLHDAKGHQKEIQISVQDHGPGISATEVSQIFKPFYRSPRVVDAQIHGTGLGLAVAKRIAEAMGGRLTVASQLGAGSTFTLHLPVTSRSDNNKMELPVVQSPEVHTHE